MVSLSSRASDSLAKPAAIDPAQERDAILTALAAHIGQRSGIDARDYFSDWRDKNGRAAFASDQYTIARDGRHARALLAAVRWRDISAEDLKSALRRAFSGRLSWDGRGLSYCTGQYFCTEYRAAACAVLALALWRYWCEQMPESATAADIRRKARQELGRGIAARWFD